MDQTPEASSRRIVRIAVLGRAAFQLRKGEEGISVFDMTVTNPNLTSEEILSNFRSGSLLIARSLAEIEAKGLCVVAINGAASLPERLRQAHREIRPGAGISREQYKRALRELE